MRKTIFIAAITVLALGCKGEVDLGSSADPQLVEPVEETETETETPTATDPTTVTTPEDDTTTPSETQTVVEVPDFSGEQLVTYMRAIAQMLVSRPLSPDEAETIEQGKEEAMESLLREWSEEPAFADNARFLIQKKLKASGERDGIDFELPGNLVHHVVTNDLPWETILTADYCVDGSGEQIDCDTGAPYTAGVLATRAFLAGNASRFNLGRASTMMEVFACRIYPMESELQPRLEKSRLIPMFQANTPEEQTVAEAEGGFGNGNGCYSCHGQFGAHAQFFVKYDESGMYVPDADGQQDPEGELGRSVNGLMTSHMNEPTEAASEESVMFGEEVADLSEAARKLATSEPFLPCQVKNVLQHTFGLSEGGGVAYPMLKEIAAGAREANPKPTYGDLVVATFTHPRVILSFFSEPTDDEAGDGETP